MLKTRIIPTMLYKKFGLVKGVKFDSWRRVGSVTQTIKVYNLRQVDELVFLDICATSEKRSPDFNLIDEIADECFVPLAVGGGVRTIDDVNKLLRVGADKVIINTEAIKRPEFIKEASDFFGSQCMVVSIDVKRDVNKGLEVFTHSGRKATGLNPAILAKQFEDLGAGEIILTSIDNDGTMTGYDYELIKNICSKVSIPVIASGGAGNYNHMELAVKNCGASAVAAASIFHFTQQTPLEAKYYLSKRGIPTRV